MSNREIELAELVDGCMDVVELWKTESPAQVQWKKDWLEKAWRLVPQNKSQRMFNLSADIQAMIIQKMVEADGRCIKCGGTTLQVIPTACDNVIKIECCVCWNRVEYKLLANEIMKMMGEAR